MDPQTCTKCSALPEDILMLACSHDLCLNCAADRLAFEMKKKKNVNSIVCEFCYQRTPLDSESITQLQKLIPSSKSVSRNYADNTTSKYDHNPEPKTSYTPAARIPASEYAYQKTASRPYDRTDRSRVGGSSSDIFNGIPSKKQCNDHPDQQILYFCFDCKCECICPECIIHGRHKDHDVKTIKKSHPIVKSEIDSSIDRMENNIQGLLIKKSQIEKQIRSLNEQNNVSKRQIQQGFEDLRAKISSQERQILSRCDQTTNESVIQMEGMLQSIVSRIDDIKVYSTTLKQAQKKNDILFLNFYSRKWQQIKQEEKEPQREVPNVSVPSNQGILSGILDASDHVSRIGSTNKINTRVY